MLLLYPNIRPDSNAARQMISDNVCGEVPKHISWSNSKFQTQLPTADPTMMLFRGLQDFSLINREHSQRRVQELATFTNVKGGLDLEHNKGLQSAGSPVTQSSPNAKTEICNLRAFLKEWLPVKVQNGIF
eukprot:sb/3475150/